MQTRDAVMGSNNCREFSQLPVVFRSRGYVNMEKGPPLLSEIFLKKKTTMKETAVFFTFLKNRFS